jgi:catechol 2,3-dioxygenase-like lactoylglutathione lyase family enzyme
MVNTMANKMAMNHVGITVPDIHAAVKWYTEVMGCYLLAAPAELKDDGSHFGKVVKDVFGERFKTGWIAHLATVNGVGIELFQFLEPKSAARDDNFEYWRGGIFHVCFTAPDIEETAELIERSGGKVKSQIWKLWNNKNYKIVYCEDPWGTIIELSDHSYVQLWSNHEPPSND